MKIRRKLFLTTALASLLGMGVFAGVASLKPKAAEKVSADTVAANKRIYLNLSSFSDWKNDSATFKMWFKKGGSDVCNASGTAITVKGSSDDIRVFTPTAQYDSVYVERRNSGDTQHYNGFDLSGSTSKNVVKISDWNSGDYDNGTYNIYYETVSASTGGSAVMHLKGDSTKSGNGYYYNHNGLTLKATANSGYHFLRWTRGGAQVSTNTTYTIDTIGGDYAWNAVFGHNDYTVNFYLDDKTTLYDSVPATAGETVSCSKSNPTKSSEGHISYTFAGWVDSNGNPANLSNIQSNMNVYASFNASYAFGRYMTGVFGSCNWGVEGASIMTKFNENEYRTTVNLEFGDKVKCAYYDGSDLSSYFGYTQTSTTCGAYFCFTNDGDDNLVCYAGGTYIFYFTDKENGYGSGKRISVEIDGTARTAEQLAAKLMSYGEAKPLEPGDNTCGTKFPDCKSMYLNNLSTDEKTTFRGYVSSENTQFKNAYDRYVAWAAALGEKPWESGKVNAAIKLTESISSSNAVTIVIAISTVCLAAFGGYFLFKKKHQ